MSELGKYQNEFSRMGKERAEAGYKKVMLILGVASFVAVVVFGVLEMMR